jgi:hypothetical protein
MTAQAEEKDDEYLLGDLGVRVDLPKSWKMLRWSDWDFRAEPADGKMQLYVWATPVQQAIVEDDLTAWSAVHLAKVETLNGTDAALAASTLVDVGGRKAGRFDVAFRFGGKSDALLIGASVPVEGQTVHLAVLTATVRAAQAQRAMTGVLERLDVRKPPAEIAWGGSVTAQGVSTTLPQGWRTPMEQELALVQEIGAALGMAKALDVEDMNVCWTALRPQAGTEPEVMFTCPGAAIMDIGLGLADEASFEQVESELRSAWFGAAEVPAATRVDMADRTGFVYASNRGSRGLVMGLVGYGDGLSHTWASGSPENVGSISTSVADAMRGSTYEGTFPVTVSERFLYAMSYNPTSPLVMGPAALLLGVLGGGVYLATRKRDPYADFDE